MSKRSTNDLSDNSLNSQPLGWVPQEEFTRAVAVMPLVSVDLVVLNERSELLLGLRNNRPAKGWWFTPGARVRKKEPLDQAIKRVWHEELGQSSHCEVPPHQLLGAWEHLYEDSAFSEDVSTHYVNLPHLIRLGQDQHIELTDLPNEQHSHWRWLALKDAAQHPEVHGYVKIYARHLSGV